MKKKNYGWIYDVVDQLVSFSAKNGLEEITKILIRTQRDLNKFKK